MALPVAQPDEKNAVASRVEPGGLEIELRPHELVETETAKIRAPRRHQVLLFRQQREHGGFAELAQVTQRTAEPPACPAQDRSGERARVVGTYEVTKRALALELLVGDSAACRTAPLGL